MYGFLFSEEMRRWFLNQETELLKCRFLKLRMQERKDFLGHYKNEFNLDAIEFEPERVIYIFYTYIVEVVSYVDIKYLSNMLTGLLTVAGLFSLCGSTNTYLT